MFFFAEATEIDKNWSEQLNFPVDDKLVQAGSGRMDEFGVWATVDTLAQGKVWRYDDVMKQPMSVIFIKLKMDGVKAEISKKYAEILNSELTAKNKK